MNLATLAREETPPLSSNEWLGAMSRCEDVLRTAGSVERLKFYRDVLEALERGRPIGALLEREDKRRALVPAGSSGR